jgi:hypothetical protein
MFLFFSLSLTAMASSPPSKKSPGIPDMKDTAVFAVSIASVQQRGAAGSPIKNTLTGISLTELDTTSDFHESDASRGWHCRPKSFTWNQCIKPDLSELTDHSDGLPTFDALWPKLWDSIKQPNVVFVFYEDDGRDATLLLETCKEMKLVVPMGVKVSFVDVVFVQALLQHKIPVDSDIESKLCKLEPAYKNPRSWVVRDIYTEAYANAIVATYVNSQVDGVTHSAVRVAEVTASWLRDESIPVVVDKYGSIISNMDAYYARLVLANAQIMRLRVGGNPTAPYTGKPSGPFLTDSILSDLHMSENKAVHQVMTSSEVKDMTDNDETHSTMHGLWTDAMVKDIIAAGFINAGKFRSTLNNNRGAPDSPINKIVIDNLTVAFAGVPDSVPKRTLVEVAVMFA